MFGSTVYDDGSCLYPTDRTLRRTGYSVAQLGPDRKAMVVAYGPSPHSQEAGAAEMHAAMVAKRQSTPSLKIFADHQVLAHGALKGMHHTTSANHAYSEVWLECWEVVNNHSIP